jgi:hypothetical protein
MRTMFRWLFRTLAGLIVILALGAAWGMAEMRLHKTWSFEVKALPLPPMRTRSPAASTSGGASPSARTVTAKISRAERTS